MWDRSRPVFVYGQCIRGGGGKSQWKGREEKKQVGCTLLDFVKVCSRALKARVLSFLTCFVKRVPSQDLNSCRFASLC